MALRPKIFGYIMAALLLGFGAILIVGALAGVYGTNGYAWGIPFAAIGGVLIIVSWRWLP